MTHLGVVAVHCLEAHLILQTKDKDDSIHPLGKLKHTHTDLHYKQKQRLTRTNFNTQRFTETKQQQNHINLTLKTISNYFVPMFLGFYILQCEDCKQFLTTSQGTSLH